MEHYGALKAACEVVVDEVYGDRGASVRAGLIVGPYDPTDRFTYWPRRIAAGGDVLGPGDPDAPVQFVDARDLASWLVRLAVGGVGGVFNATGPAESLRFADFLRGRVPPWLRRERHLPTSRLCRQRGRALVGAPALSGRRHAADGTR